MTQPLVRPASPPPGHPPASPSAAAPFTGPPHGAPPEPVPERRSPWRDGVRRLRSGATTEPGRLRLLGGVLALLIVVFGAVTTWQVAERTAAADAVGAQGDPLADTARIYRSLADADTVASSGLLAGGDEPRSSRDRYDRDVGEASRLLAATAATRSSAAAQRQIEVLSQRLPVYTGLVESARANNRQGLPLGGAYMRRANDEMRERLLPAADRLYDAESAELGQEYARAKNWPWAAFGTGVLALAALLWVQRRNYRRSNRVFNLGLLGATAACAAVLAWVAVGHLVARADLERSSRSGAQSLRVLNEAWIGALQARGNENMWLVARGSGTSYETTYLGQMTTLAGPNRRNPDGTLREDADRLGSGLLGEAYALADDAAGRRPVKEAEALVQQWRDRHKKVHAADGSGEYDDAVRLAVGGKDTTGESFDAVDASLGRASAHEQRQFDRAADDSLVVIGRLALGAALLALAGAVAAVLGLGRRLSEYR